MYFIIVIHSFFVTYLVACIRRVPSHIIFFFGVLKVATRATRGATSKCEIKLAATPLRERN